MNVGLCKISLRLPENMSLKEKRQTLKPMTAQLKKRFNISVAEVDNHDRWQLATLGIAFVSNDKGYTNEVLSKVVKFIASGRFDVEILDHEIEILSF